VTGPIEILVALIAVTIVLAAVFFVRPSVTAGATGKVLAFVALCVLPVLCIDAGMSAHMQRSEQTQFCISCHTMETHGQSLYIDDPNAIPAQHFQNHLVPADTACYACHTDYTIFGPLKDKLQGMKRIYMQYVSTPPKVIEISGGYSNLQCLHCHAGARGFMENPIHSALMASLASNQVSCITSGCHDSIHNASEVGNLKMWRPGQ
jgi:cytochrome c-type protein NapC